MNRFATFALGLLLLACSSETTSTKADAGSPAICPSGESVVDAAVAGCKVDADCEVRATCCGDREKYPKCSNVDPGNCRAVPRGYVELSCETPCNNVQSPCAEVLPKLSADAAGSKIGARCDNGSCLLAALPL